MHLINVSLPLHDATKTFELRISEGKWQQISVQEKPNLCDPAYLAIDQWDDNNPMESYDLLQLDLKGKVLLPGMVDIHMHLDKALTINDISNPEGTLWGAIENYKKAVDQFSEEMLRQRMKQTVLQAFSFGTTAIRSHLNFNSGHSEEVLLRTFHAALQVKQDLQGIVDIQLYPMLPPKGLTDRMVDLFEETMQMGMDGVGGASHLGDDPQQNIEEIFRIAIKYDKPIDLHTDENDDPSIKTVDYVAEQTMRHGLQGNVTVDHLCSLAGMPHEEAERIMTKMAQARLMAVTLPLPNMYLQGRADRGIIRRGVTRIKELIQAGVLLATASDNIQDCFHPFGRGDLLQVGLMTAYAAQMASDEEVAHILKMMTHIPAHIFGIQDYGIAAGHQADFVVFDATSVNELFSMMPESRWVFRKGERVYSSVSKQKFHK